MLTFFGGRCSQGLGGTFRRRRIQVKTGPQLKTGYPCKLRNNLHVPVVTFGVLRMHGNRVNHEIEGFESEGKTVMIVTTIAYALFHIEIEDEYKKWKNKRSK